MTKKANKIMDNVKEFEDNEDLRPNTTKHQKKSKNDNMENYVIDLSSAHRKLTEEYPVKTVKTTV